jgi:ethanolamine utilization protein EutQ (cupin superfamily)
MEPHWCDRGHLGYILEGRLEIEFAEGRCVFDAGDGVVIPGGAGSRHRARVLTDAVRAVFVEDA